jgi:hypothetical protein
MKVTFDFDMSEDRDDFNIYSKAPDMHTALWEMSQYLRRCVKYHQDEYGDYETFSKVQDEFDSILSDHNISLP